MRIIPNILMQNPRASKSQYSFKGLFFLMTDTHSRLPMSLGTLSKIGEKIHQSQKTTTLIDAGDCFHKAFDYKTVQDSYLKFKSKNQNTNIVLNLGNVEIGSILNGDKKLLEIYKNLKAKGIKIISSAVQFLKEKGVEIPDNSITPYTIVEDVVDGVKKKVLIVGTSIEVNNKIDIESQKNMLKNVFKLIEEKKEQYDEMILVSHNFCNETDKLNDFIKNDLGVKKLNLIVGGHPHSLNDYEYKGTRSIYPPCHGKGSVVSELTPKGFISPKMQIGHDKFDYHSLLLNKEDEIIVNIDISNRLPIDEDYYEIIKNTPQMNELVCICPFDLTFRNSKDPLGFPSEIGTFLTNAIRERTNSDFAFLLTMDFREQLPSKGRKILMYNIDDTLNVSKPIWKLYDLNAENLREIFEISLKKQKDGSSNSDFLEFSNNLKIVRFCVKEENARKVKQIYIKENGKWNALFDKSGKVMPEFEKRKFTVSTCEFVANGGRLSLSEFKRFTNKSEFLQEGRILETKEILIKALKETQVKPECSEILTL